MNSKRPPQAPQPNEQAKPQEAPKAPGVSIQEQPLADVSPDERFLPQSLPQDDDLAAKEPLDVETEDEKMKRLEREAEINKVPPEPENTTGPDTTGVGQPTLQPVNQGQSLPAAPVPVEKTFEGKAEQFYNPMDTERAVSKKNRADSGGQKADF